LCRYRHKGHYSGAPNRCDRQFGKRFGDDAYAMEELVAELGAAFLCADLGVTLTPRPDHAAYIDNWLKVLKADKKAIFTAASAAAKATDFLGGLHSEDTTEAAA
ncbi:zincin-like metallopeptidase domain-containing protein, partial [Stappia sp. P2PMeth1]|uniref:zincin-like metallopeptidase domain-containing protein n=1 Tax=Stappia sp. P2PMeth1 TaxID=2003586 RepID=UPI001FCC19A3